MDPDTIKIIVQAIVLIVSAWIAYKVQVLQASQKETQHDVKELTNGLRKEARLEGKNEERTERKERDKEEKPQDVVVKNAEPIVVVDVAKKI